ncbi:MAG: phosphate regulon sensor histidine kinase PhoR [Brachymonas sp.]|nr:phosphate regulon sensor histidine kinase PhoR [Brachymonas sp.]
MNSKTIGLFTMQALALCVCLLLRQRGHEAAAFWLLLATVLGSSAWIARNATLGARLLRWLQQGDGAEPPHLPQPWQDFADASLATRRKQMRKTALVQEKLKAFLDAIQALPIGVVLLDEQGHMEWFNLIASEHFGFNDPQDLNQQIIHLVRDPQFVSYWLRGPGEQGIAIHGRKHTAQHPVKVSVQTFAFGEGKRLLLSRDVTLLEQTERMRRDFVSNVSHEIRTPLTVLMGFVETLQSLPLSEAERQRYLHLMTDQAQRMQLLVDDLLMLSRLEGSPPPDTSEHVSLVNLLQQCVRDAQSLSRVLGHNPNAAGQPQAAHHITLANQMDADLQIMGSHGELRSAISNLLSNAVRYTPAGGHIALQATPTETGSLRIAVSDTGPGIAREHLVRITERFYRVDKSRSRETGGTGLGLAIVKHVTQRHQATLEIDSEVGRGSCFALVFPPQRLLHGPGDPGIDTHAGQSLQAAKAANT